MKAQAAEDVANGDALLGQILDLQKRTLSILTSAERDGDARSALVAIHQARENVSFLSKLLAELRPPPATAAAWAAAERQYTINVVPYELMMDSKIPPHEALLRLVEQGWMSQDEADEAMRRKRDEAEPRLKALGPGKQAEDVG